MVTNTRWPTRDDYDIAMEDLADNMQELELRRGQLLRTPRGVPVQYGLPETHTCLYRIDQWMIRCFCRVGDKDPDEKLLERYRMLSKFSREHLTQVSALIPLQFIEWGLKVPIFKRDRLNNPIELLDEHVVPVVKMPFVQGLSLGTFIAAKHKNTEAMRQLGAAWLRMIREMEDVPMAHGDLDLTNVRVQEDPSRGEVSLKLIDYDNTWIPDFRSGHHKLAEFGHEYFQHPLFFDNESAKFDETIDRFAALVIYISIQLLLAFPEYYGTWQMSENKLIFSPADYKAEQKGHSERIRELRNLRIRGLEPYIDELASCLRYNIIMPSSLSSIAGYRDRPPTRAQETAESITDRLPFDPRNYREMVIPDWSSLVYFDKSQRRPPTASPYPSPEREQPNIQAQAPSVQQAEDVPAPSHDEEPAQPAQSTPEQPLAQYEEPVKPTPSAPAQPPEQENTVEQAFTEAPTEKRLPPSIENAHYMTPQGPMRLGTYDASDTYNPSAGTQRVGDAGLPAAPLLEREKRFQQSQHLQKLQDPATRLGLRTILLTLLFIAIIILLILILAHGHSSGLSPVVHPPVVHMVLMRVALASLTPLRGDCHVA